MEPVKCEHKTKHTHGTRPCYVHCHCRCDPCTEANRVEAADRRRAQLYGRYNKYVPADIVRDHITMLMDSGIGFGQIKTLARVPRGTLSVIVYGKRRSDGNRRHSTRVEGRIAQRILAVTPGFDQIADGALVDPTGTRRRLQALVALGYSQRSLAPRLGMTPPNLTQLLRSNAEVRKRTATAVLGLFEELAMTTPTATNRFEKGSIAKARAFAEARGWPPPLAWDDDTIDDPAAKPSQPRGPRSHPVDNIAVVRALDGIPPEQLTAAEKVLVVAALSSRGLSDPEIARMANTTARTVQRIRATQGIPSPLRKAS